MTDPVEVVLLRLEHVRRSGGRFRALCPAHDDRLPSLSITAGDDGRVLLICRAGCSLDSIVAAIGLSVSDLFVPRNQPLPVRLARRPAPRPQPLPTAAQLARFQKALQPEPIRDRLLELRGWTPEAIDALGLGVDRDRVTIPIYDQAGKLANLVRYAPNPETRSGSKMLALRGRPRELFPAPETHPPGERIFLVEGEADAIRGISLGLAAVAVPGTSGWKPAWAERLAGRDVAIVFDCDQAGRAAAHRIAADLIGTATDVHVVDLNPDIDDGTDLTYWTAAATTDREREHVCEQLNLLAEGLR